MDIGQRTPVDQRSVEKCRTEVGWFRYAGKARSQGEVGRVTWTIHTGMIIQGLPAPRGNASGSDHDLIRLTDTTNSEAEAMTSKAARASDNPNTPRDGVSLRG